MIFDVIEIVDTNCASGWCHELNTVKIAIRHCINQTLSYFCFFLCCDAFLWDRYLRYFFTVLRCVVMCFYYGIIIITERSFCLSFFFFFWDVIEKHQSLTLTKFCFSVLQFEQVTKQKKVFSNGDIFSK